MSGPLASWVGKHSEGSWRARLVVKELALACRPDGRPVEPVTREQIRDRTGVGMTTIRQGLAEARELGRAGKRGGVLQLDPGGGRGLSSLYRVVVELCPVEAGCRECDTLRPNRPEETGRQAPRLAERAAPNRAPRDRNRAPGAPPTETGNGSPTTGGTVTHPESSAALAPDGAALEPGQPDPAKNGQGGYGPPTGLPPPIKAMVDQAKAELRAKGTVRQLRDPGREIPPAEEATSA
jgi:hypothetical protein